MSDPYTFNAERERAHRETRKAAREQDEIRAWAQSEERRAAHESDMDFISETGNQFPHGMDISNMRRSTNIEQIGSPREPFPNILQRMFPADQPARGPLRAILNAGSLINSAIAKEAGIRDIGRSAFDDRFSGESDVMQEPGADADEERQTRMDRRANPPEILPPPLFDSQT